MPLQSGDAGGRSQPTAIAGPSVHAVYVVKAAAMAAMLILFWTLRLAVFPGVPAEPYTLLVLLALIPTAGVAAWRGNVPDALLATSLGADIGAIAIAIYFGGGPDNTSGPLLYALVITLSALLFSQRAAYWTAAASAASYGAVSLGEATGLLVHRLPYGKPPNDVMATVITVAAYLFLSAWIASQAVRQVHQTQDRAQELRDEAVAALSHDLKNPLAIIDGYAEMLDAVPAAEHGHYARRIRTSARQALEMVHNVLDSAAFDQQPLLPALAPVDVNQLVAQLVDLYQPGAEAKGVRLTTELMQDTPILDADGQLLSRAIGNLLSNAIKFTPSAGTVCVRTQRAGAAVEISVRDSGTGIAAADRAYLFQKYGHPHSRHGSEGSGLGLYIVRRIAEAYGGTVGVESEAGKGSTFSMRLPAQPPTDEGSEES